MKTKPWMMLLVMMAGWMNRHQQDVIEFLREENKILREKLGTKRVILNDNQRMSISALLGAVIFVFTIPKKEVLSIFELELEMLCAHQNSHQQSSISLHTLIFAPINPYCVNTYKADKQAENPYLNGSLQILIQLFFYGLGVGAVAVQ